MIILRVRVGLRIILWNVRSLGSDVKIKSLKRIIKNAQAYVLFLSRK